MLKKKITVGVLLFFVIFSTFSTANTIVENNSTLTSNGKTLYVGGTGPTNYTSIQDAVDNANDGDTIFVYNGTYYENLIINKTINLVGEDKNTTIIDGSKKGNTIHVISENSTITGFTITNGSLGENKTSGNWFYAGIRLTGSNNTINGNKIQDNTLGIFGKKVTNITIYNNEFNRDGIVFSLYDIENEPIPFHEEYFIHNIYNNTVNGRKIYYYKNQKNINVPNDAGQIIAVNCSKMIIKHVNLTNADYGCILVNCTQCLIEHSNISHEDGMLWLIHSKNNKIQYNNISYNFEGICLDCKSTKNIIQYNTISNNQILGLIIEDRSNYNKICKNDFIKNNQNNPFFQVYFIDSFFNKWRKNYWGKTRILPKIILGKENIGFLNIPCFNFDFRPAKTPNNQ